MRIIRVEHGGTSYYGILEDGLVFRLHQQPGHMEPIPLSEAKVLPLVTPSKVVCVGLNYKAHAEELGYPLPNMPSFFLKPPSSIIGNGEPIVLPSGMGRIEHEAELADYRAAKATMGELLGGEKLPKMAELKEKRRQLAARKKALYADYRTAQEQMRQAVAVKTNIDHLLGVTDGRKNKEQER